jgi:hypothetical protein
MRRTSRMFLACVVAAAGSIGGPAYAVPSPTTSASGDSILAAEVAQQLHDYPGGVEIAPDTVAYRNGTVRVVFADPSTGYVAARNSSSTSASDTVVVPPDPSALTTSFLNGCPYTSTTRWFCFYQNSNFGGTMLQFSDCSSTGTIQYFSTYGFANQTSSWVNTRTTNSGSIKVYDTDTTFTLLWTEVTGAGMTSSSYVGAAANDQADYFDCFS